MVTTTLQVDTGYCAAVLLGHNDAVTCLTLDRDQQRVISGSLDRTIKVGRERAVFCSLLLHNCTKGLYFLKVSTCPKIY